MGLGGEIIAGNSKLTAQPLGVVKGAFAGYDLGKTVEEATLMPESDVKDIFYQQDGTKGADHVITGEDYAVKLVFGEIKTKLLTLMKFGVTSLNELTTDDHGVVGRELYQSMRDNFAGVLKLAAVSGNGVPSDDEEDIMFFYEAIPIVDGPLINWGADTQRNLTVIFRIKYHEFATGESSTHEGSFGYWGDPTSEDLPAATWPDVEAPTIATAIATAATTLVITFDENIAFQPPGSAFDASHYMADVDGEFNPPTAGVIATTALTLTFAAATFAAGDVIKLSISSVALQDTDATPNEYPGVSNYLCTNSVP